MFRIYHQKFRQTSNFRDWQEYLKKEVANMFKSITIFVLLSFGTAVHISFAENVEFKSEIKFTILRYLSKIQTA